MVAEYDGRLVASLLVAPCWIDLANGPRWWIHCIYVQPEFRKKGCYSSLYDYVLSEAQSLNIGGIRLKVDPNNLQAKAAYEKLGMTCSRYLHYDMDLD